jgi:hypothetical protein
MKVPTEKRQVTLQFEIGYRKPRSTTEAEKYRFKAAEVAHERTIESLESQREISSIYFAGDLLKSSLQIAQNIVKAKEAVEFTKAETEARKALDDLWLRYTSPREEYVSPAEQELGKEPEPRPSHETWGEKFQSDRESIKESTLEKMKSPGAKEEFSLRYERLANATAIKLEDEAQTRTIYALRAEALENYDYAVADNDFFRVKEIVYRDVNLGLFNAVEGKTLIDGARKRIAYNVAKKAAYSMPYEKGMTFVDSPEMGEVLKKYGLDPKDLTEEMRDKLLEEIKTEYEYRKAQVKEARKLEIDRINSEFFQRYTEPNIPVGELKKLREDIRKSYLPWKDKEKWVNSIDKDIEDILKEEDEEDETRWEITKPEIDAKVVDYITKPEPSKEQKAKFIKKYHGAGLSTGDVNKYLKQIGWPEEEKSKKPGSEPQTLIELTDLVLDPTVDYYTKNKAIRDATIEKKVTPVDARTLDSRAKSRSVTWYEDLANEKGNAAYNQGWIDDKQLANYKKALLEEISTGEYTEKGVLNLADNLLMQYSKDYAGAVLREAEGFKWKPLRWREKREQEEIERYIAEHPPERKPNIEPGSIDDFMMLTGVDKEEVEVTQDSQGNEVLLVRGDYFGFMEGAWYMLGTDGWMPMRGF